MVRGFTTKLNNSGSKLLHFGQNPHRDFQHEFRIADPRKGRYIRINFVELETFITMAKQSTLDMPFRVSTSLFCTKTLFNGNDEVFHLERKCKVPDTCVNQMYIGIKSLEHLRELYPILRTTYEDTESQTSKDFENFLEEIVNQFESRPPTFNEIVIWYSECGKTSYVADRNMHNLIRELLMNFGSFVVKEVQKHIQKQMVEDEEETIVTQPFFF